MPYGTTATRRACALPPPIALPRRAPLRAASCPLMFQPRGRPGRERRVLARTEKLSFSLPFLVVSLPFLVVSQGGDVLCNRGGHRDSREPVRGKPPSPQLRSGHDTTVPPCLCARQELVQMLGKLLVGSTADGSSCRYVSPPSSPALSPSGASRLQFLRRRLRVQRARKHLQAAGQGHRERGGETGGGAGWGAAGVRRGRAGAARLTLAACACAAVCS